MLLPSLLGLYKGETGRLIVASGKMTDPNFSETAVYMFDHSYHSAYGVVINRPLPETDRAKIPEFLRDKKIPLYYGGPADYPEAVIILERNDDKLVSHEFNEAVLDDPEYLTKVVSSIQAGENRYRVYLGYAGWGLMQLEREFGMGVWASTELNPDWITYERLSGRDVWLEALQAANNKRKPRNPGAI